VDRANPRAFESAVEAGAAASDLVVVAGGDGTVHSVLGVLARTGTPLYHLPFGTENLFAREFGMSRDVRTLLASLRVRAAVRTDLGMISHSSGGCEHSCPFAIMCSIGPDASVVHRLAKVRRGAISHRAYVAPIAKELIRPWVPMLTIRVDGVKIVDRARGLCIIANYRQYALRVDPAREASPHDGLLDAVFLPAGSGIAAGLALLAARARLKASRVRASGTHVEVICHDQQPVYQVDGEAGRSWAPDSNGQAILRFGVMPAALRVIRVGRMWAQLHEIEKAAAPHQSRGAAVPGEPKLVPASEPVG
jgi:diacylglycerol kinase family enzyme